MFFDSFSLKDFHGLHVVLVLQGSGLFSLFQLKTSETFG